MWILGKVDQTSQKEQVFLSLCNECKTIAPSAQLSYKLRNRLERFSAEERQEIVNQFHDGCAPLFIACQRGNTEVVEYLIATCHAEVEAKGIYNVSEDNSVHHVTPLWCAAVAGKLSVVKCLIRHAANVNSVSDTGSTPVRSACFMTYLDIVTYLVKNGADINKANYNGGTCLINSVQSAALCEYLIKHGANVNAQDTQHKTALHYAIHEHRFRTTKLLLEHEAEPFLKSKYNDDALQTACIKGASDIFKYLIQTVNYSPERIAEGYELLGSTFLDEHDIQLALKYWRKSVNIRKKNNISKKLPKQPCKAFDYMTEFTTLEDLESIALDLNSARTQSLLIYQRILGTSHKDMIYRLMSRGASYADSSQYQKCINLWFYALQLKINRDTILVPDTCFTAQALVRLYLDMIEKCNNNQITDTVKYEDAYNTLELLSWKLMQCIHLKHVVEPLIKQQSTFDTMMNVLTYVVFVLINIRLTAQEKHNVAVVLNRLIRMNPRTDQDGYSLLHLAAMKSSSLCNNGPLEGQQMTPFSSEPVIKFLIECGADVNCVTEKKGISPLYIASEQKNYNEEVVRTLIENGAHIDQMTHARESPSALLARNPNCTISLVAFTSLKCLAAKVIQANRISYEGEIPSHLESFIRMH